MDLIKYMKIARFINIIDLAIFMQLSNIEFDLFLQNYNVYFISTLYIQLEVISVT